MTADSGSTELRGAVADMRHQETCDVFLASIEPQPDDPTCDCGLARVARAAEALIADVVALPG